MASKATGFPIAKIAAKLAVGYTLDELENDITKATPASFEPSIDYVVTKIPRFAFEKFPNSPAVLSTAMKSVGEAMAIGRSFQESIQKALSSMETGLTGFDEVAIEGMPSQNQIVQQDGILIGKTTEIQTVIDKVMTRELAIQSPDRMRAVSYTHLTLPTKRIV